MTKKNETRLRWGIFLLCQMLAAVTIVRVLMQGSYGKLWLVAVTAVLLCLPGAAERWGKCRMHPALFVCTEVYLTGPLLGSAWGLYYTTGWWDKLLHFAGGALFSIAGLYLHRKLSGGVRSRLLCGVFAVCFSVTVGVVWEFAEFGADRLLDSDMQRDTVVTELHSCDLGSGGRRGSITDIRQVEIDGVPLPFAGYLDIGLMDTMTDLILAALGAAAAVLVWSCTRGRLRLITDKINSSQNQDESDRPE